MQKQDVSDDDDDTAAATDEDVMVTITPTVTRLDSFGVNLSVLEQIVQIVPIVGSQIIIFN